jgi:CRP-like cAMP-binding protein
MDEFINNGLSAHKSGRTDYLDAKTVSGAQSLVEEIARKKLAYAPPKPIPFNGLLTNKLLAALPGADFARLLPYLEPVALLPNQDIYKFGEAINFVYFPETAIVSHLYFLEDGSTTAAAIVGREGIIGLSAIFGSCPPSYWTQVTIGGSAMRAETEVIMREFQRGGALQQLLLTYTSTRLAQLSQRAVCNGRHKLEARLCTWLMMIHDRVSEEPLLLTHEEIAHHLGARRAGITTSCNALREMGAIDYSRGRIHIIDRDKLETAACECYRNLKQAFQQPFSC